MKSIKRIIIILISFIVISELLLQLLTGFCFNCNLIALEKSQQETDKYRILYIGDFSIINEVEPEHIKNLNNLLSEEYPDMDIDIMDMSAEYLSSFQSALELLKHYEEASPDMLLILSGSNDQWNNLEAEKSLRALSKERGFMRAVIENLDISYPYNITEFSKVFRIIRYFFKGVSEKAFTNRAIFKYMTYYRLMSEFQRSKALDELKKIYEEDLEYQPFYNILMEHFEYNESQVVQYLKDNQILKPESGDNIDWNKYRFYKKHHYKVLEKELVLLQKICNSKGITMIVLDYPRPKLHQKQLNALIKKTVNKNNMHFVDLDSALVKKEDSQDISENIFNYIDRRRILYK